MGKIRQVQTGETIANKPNLWATQTGAQKKGGWATVTYRDAMSGERLTVKMRAPVLRDLLKSGKGKYHTAESRVYSYMINNTKQGELFTAMRQVEGMLKTALIKGDSEMAFTLENLLASGSPEEIADFRANWEETHSDEEIKDYYSYDPALRQIGPANLWDEEEQAQDWTRFT